MAVSGPSPAPGRSGPTASSPVSNPWLIAIVVALATFMEVLDSTIANVALPYIAGGLGVSQDEASWVVTTYLVANAIILTASSFLAKAFGRKAFFIACLALFTASSIVCGFCDNLGLLLLFRVLQGLGGGGMVPVAQSILADSFPADKRGQAFALFGVAVVVAPVVGPTLGGWLSDTYSWQWCFFINGPVGLMAIVLIQILFHEPAPGEGRTANGRRVPFDVVGFGLVATFLGALELALDRGLDDDWFSSSFVVTVSAICVFAFVAMIPWEMTRKAPMIDIRMVVTRQFGSCFLVMMASGILLLATTQFLPQLVQQDFGYTATWAGLVLTPGGIVTMGMMFAVGPLSSRVQPKYLIAAGAAICALSMYDMTNVYTNIGFWSLARSRMLLGLGLPLVFLPITTASYDGLSSDKTDQASALINAARNTGGSIGVSLASNVLAHREQFHQSRLAEHAIPSSINYQDTLQRVSHYFVDHGKSMSQAQQQAVNWIGQQVQAQASLLAYADVFWVLMIISAAAVPLALILRNVKLGASVPMGH